MLELVLMKLAEKCWHFRSAEMFRWNLCVSKLVLLDFFINFHLPAQCYALFGRYKN